MTYEIRKTKKRESINKRRKLGPVAANNHADPNNVDTTTQIDELSIYSLYEVLKKQHVDPDSVNNEVLLSRVQEAHRLLETTGGRRVVELVLRYGVHHLLKYTLSGASVHVPPEILSSIIGVFVQLTDARATSSDMDAIWNTGVIEQLPRFMSFDFAPGVRKQAALCIAHLARDNETYRAAILAEEKLRYTLVQNIDNPDDGSVLCAFANCLQYLLQSAPWEYKRYFAHVIPKALHTCHVRFCAGLEVGDSVVKEVTLALVYISQQADEKKLDLIFKPQIPQILVEMINRYLSCDSAMLTIFVRALGNLASGSTEQTARVVKTGFIDLAPTLLQHKSRNLSRYTLWLLSNIAADCASHTKQVVKCSTLWPFVLHQACNGYYPVRREALWLIVNVIQSGNQKCANYMVRQGAFDCFGHFLSNLGEVEMSLQILESIKVAIQYSKDAGLDYEVILETHGVLRNIERQLDHPDQEVSSAAETILEQVCGSEDKLEEVENIEPVATDSSFEFGVPPKKLFSDEESPQTSLSPLTFNFGGDVKPMSSHSA
jgi:hypothetical protein